MEITIEDLKQIRNYFGEHDVSIFEHKAFDIMNALVKERQELSREVSLVNICKDTNCNYCHGTGEIKSEQPTIGKISYYQCFKGGLMASVPHREEYMPLKNWEAK